MDERVCWAVDFTFYVGVNSIKLKGGRKSFKKLSMWVRFLNKELNLKGDFFIRAISSENFRYK